MIKGHSNTTWLFSDTPCRKFFKRLISSWTVKLLRKEVTFFLDAIRFFQVAITRNSIMLIYFLTDPIKLTCAFFYLINHELNSCNIISIPLSRLTWHTMHSLAFTHASLETRWERSARPLFCRREPNQGFQPWRSRRLTTAVSTLLFRYDIRSIHAWFPVPISFPFVFSLELVMF